MAKYNGMLRNLILQLWQFMQWHRTAILLQYSHNIVGATATLNCNFNVSRNRYAILERKRSVILKISNKIIIFNVNKNKFKPQQ